ncbi:mechanosensitive ion channel family protein [Haloarchaeobius sp. HRN-SO-5]|uniref:mechanosensitive ion channel family protein n=1 Tax=Haloarchaeobius sp. HRN-SO-5 TaxID=3446118 RepID=UPI003EBE363B
MFAGLTDFLSAFPLWQRTALVLGISLVAAVVIETVVLRVARRFVRGTESLVDNIVVDELRVPLVVTAALAGVWVLTDPAQTGSTGTDVFGQDELRMFFGQPSASVIVLVWARSLNNIVNRVVEEVQDGGRYDFAPVFSNVWTLVVLVGATFFLLDVWNLEVTPLLGAAGVAGIAVGFAAKDTVANFFGGLALYFDDTYKIGDYVVLDTGDAGTVVRVGIRSTTLLTRDEVMVTVPNSVLNSARIINESAPKRRKRIRVPLSVGYGTDLDEFESAVLDVTGDESLVKDSPRPRMRFRRFGDSGLEYELLCWVTSPNREQKARHSLNRGIYRALLDAGIEMPFPKRDVRVAVDAADRDVDETVTDPPELSTGEGD